LRSPHAPDRGTSITGYYLNDQVKTTEDADGNLLYHRYDAAGRLWQVRQGSETGPLLKELIYDGNGNLVQASYDGRTFQYDFDPLQRLYASRWWADATPQIIHATAFQYAPDHDGLQRIDYPGAGAGYAWFDYDTEGRLEVLTHHRPDATLGPKLTLEYNLDGDLEQLSRTGGSTTELHYDHRFRLNYISDTGGVQNHRYWFGPTDNLARVDDLRSGSSGSSGSPGSPGATGDRRFIYDELERLTEERADVLGVEVQYGFDLHDNRDWMIRVEDGVTLHTAYTYLNNRLATRTVTDDLWQVQEQLSYGYDLSGRLTSLTDLLLGDTHTLLWDVFGQLRQFDQVAYAYDPQGRRIQKSDSSGVTLYHYDPSGKLIAETDPQGNALRSYLRGPMGTLARHDTQSGAVFYYHLDFHGSSVAMVPQGATVPVTRQGATVPVTRQGATVPVTLTEYDAFGVTLAGTLEPDDLSYTGQLLDLESGLHYFGARYYDSVTGRFTSPDPVDAWNDFAYALNNPNKYLDPDGRVPILWVIGAAMTGYETYQGYKSGGWAGAGKVLATEAAMNLATGGMGKIAGKVGGRLMNAIEDTSLPSVSGAAGEMADAGAKALGKASDAASGAAKRGTKGGTYVLRDDATGDVVKTGRSGDLALRRKQHQRNPDLTNKKFEPVHRTDDYNAQRGLEEILYNENHAPLDKIRPISPTNKKAQKYRDAAQEYLREQEQ